MKTIEIHPLSAALGATFVGLILVTVGFSPVISSCSSGSSGSTSPPSGFGTGEGPYDVTILNDLMIDSMPSVDIASMPAISASISGEVTVLNDLTVTAMPSVDIASIPTIDANVTGSVTVLNDLTVASMPSVAVSSMPSVDIATIPAVDIASIPAVDIASMPSLDFSSLTSIRVKGIPTHEDFVVIDLGLPYTVPEGKSLVLTGFMASNADSSTGLLVRFDGVEVFNGFASGVVPTVVFPLGFHAESGVVVENASGEPFRLLGYLEEA